MSFGEGTDGKLVQFGWERVDYKGYKAEKTIGNFISLRVWEDI
jgi:hypothetical protein